MKKIKLLSILALSTVVLGACSVFSNQSSEASSDNKENTEQVEKKDEAAEVKEKVTKDAEILLDSVLTSDSARFKKIYGDTYEKWTEAVFAVQTSEKIKEEVPEKLRIAVLLSFISGYINAFTYNNAGELFAGAQTGNVIFMALHFAKGNLEKAVEFLIPIISFMIGQIFIYCFRNFFQRRGHKGYIHSSLLMLVIMIMLIVLLPFFDYHFIVVTLAFFAAIQSDTFQRLRGFSYATIMMTGNVKNAPRLLIEGLVQRDRELLVRGFLLFLIIFSKQLAY